MSRSGLMAQWSAIEWTVRGLLALISIILGYVSVTQALAYALRGKDTPRAHALAPHDGRITALMAQRLAGVDAGMIDRVRARNLSRAALRQDPTAVVAVATLGLDSQGRGDTVTARRLFTYAKRLSRRDIQTQIWAIEDAVGRGDASGALRHYDIALRTSRNAQDLLFPILASAIAERSIRTGLTKTLMGSPVWGPSFINFASANADPRAGVGLFLNLSKARIPVTDEPRARIINRLIAADFAENAWDYYATTRPKVERRASRDPHFMADLAIPTPFDWVPINDGGVSSSIQKDTTVGIFDFATPASVGGVLLKQVQMLPPGNYRLAGHSIGIDQPASGRPYWALSCGDGRELGRIEMPNSDDQAGVFAGRFTVPTVCPLQTLMLVARASELAGGLSGQIDQVRLAPAL